jgi:hypothetical protein
VADRVTASKQEMQGTRNFPSFKEGSLSPLRKMQRYLSPGEAGEVRLEPAFFSKPLSDLPRRADSKVAWHYLIGASTPPSRRGFLFHACFPACFSASFPALRLRKHT